MNSGAQQNGTRRTLCANLCCWRLKLDVLSLELELSSDDRALDVKARCIVMRRTAEVNVEFLRANRVADSAQYN
jgi:hypothetical protein